MEQLPPIEPYKPTPEEVQRAEEMMPEELKAERAEETKEKLEELANKPMRFNALKEADALGFTLEERDKLADRIVADEIEQGNPGSVFGLRENLMRAGLVDRPPGGSADDIEKISEEAYRHNMEERHFESAMVLAEKTHGTASLEYKTAKEAFDKENAEMEETDEIVLTRKATFGDIFGGMIPIGLEEAFWTEVHDNFGDEIDKELHKLVDDPAKASKTDILDFFKKRGYSKSDVEDYLPIKFGKEKKKK
ncbi:hypothetical protein M1432_02280 [Patescibacteria group bacterium]|nr:hypothetical protein [Patescibacteria group bacterium]